MRFRFYGLPLLLSAATLLPGCIPDEDPISPYNRGPVRTATAGMESDYRTQVYFDLATGTTVSQIPITGWDIGFSSGDSLPVVILNTAQIMSAADAGPIAFDDLTSTSGLLWKYDHPSGQVDSMSIGKWWAADIGGFYSRNHVYVVDRGVNAAGKKLGYKKFMVVGYDGNSYTVRFADLNGANDRTVTIAKDRQRNYIGLSFDSGTAVAFEPPARSWDIVFTRYTHIFYEPEYTPYSVTGVLLNTAGVHVAVDSVRPFAEITAADVERYTFSSTRDGVGYNWKTFYLDKGEFEVHPHIVYILRDMDGFYYKLHFIDFYDEGGQKGYPTFEYQTL